ncbi:MAG: UDP-2,4-diacetamido-2,4,6-trideoxy-beta-L-altropyranose hydrolase [Caulobacter sp.]|nr:UDP-2,4-diacetamido-2,4,6-trideoxy-beta-L-altropyranose hydrolase [Caulobacter sp.]
MTSSRILFVCDAGPGVGGGHVMRCLTLAEALAARGAVCGFVRTPEAADILARYAPDMPLVEPDAAADLLVLDSYRMTPATEAAWRGRTGRLAVIDDLARPHDCDLVLDPSFGRLARDYAAPVVLAGPSYALVRPAFAARRETALARRGAPVVRGLVSLGLTDVGGITGRAVQALAETGLALDVVVGAGAPSLSVLEPLAASGRIALHIDSSDMAGLIEQADIGVGAGGSSVWERACLGLPTVTLILADNQREMAMALDAAGTTLALDARWPDLEGRLAAAVERLSWQAGLREGLSARSAALCDGGGARRVAEALAGLLQT